MLGKHKPSILTFTNRHGREIGDYPLNEPVDDDNGSVVAYDYVDDVLPASEVQDETEIPGVSEESCVESTGVEVDPEQVPNEANFDLQDELEQVPLETSQERGTARQPTGEPTKAPVQDPVPPSL